MLFGLVQAFWTILPLDLASSRSWPSSLDFRLVRGGGGFGELLRVLCASKVRHFLLTMRSQHADMYNPAACQILTFAFVTYLYARDRYPSFEHAKPGELEFQSVDLMLTMNRTCLCCSYLHLGFERDRRHCHRRRRNGSRPRSQMGSWKCRIPAHPQW